jgi:hypothetical protein
MTTPTPLQLVEMISNGSICMTEPAVVGLIQLAELRVGASFCPDKRNYLVAYMACHMFTLASRNGDSGFITGRTEGDLSVTYANTQASSSGNELDLTSYGKVYRELCRGCVGVGLSNAYEV